MNDRLHVHTRFGVMCLSVHSAIDLAIAVMTFEVLWEQGSYHDSVLRSIPSGGTA